MLYCRISRVKDQLLSCETHPYPEAVAVVGNINPAAKIAIAANKVFAIAEQTSLCVYIVVDVGSIPLLLPKNAVRKIAIVQGNRRSRYCSRYASTVQICVILETN